MLPPPAPPDNGKEKCVICLSLRKCAHIRKHPEKGGTQLCGPIPICVPCSSEMSVKYHGDKQAGSGQLICPICRASLGSKRRALEEGTDATRWRVQADTPQVHWKPAQENAMQRAMRERNTSELRRLWQADDPQGASQNTDSRPSSTEAVNPDQSREHTAMVPEQHIDEILPARAGGRLRRLKHGAHAATLDGHEPAIVSGGVGVCSDQHAESVATASEDCMPRESKLPESKLGSLSLVDGGDDDKGEIIEALGAAAASEVAAAGIAQPEASPRHEGSVCRSKGSQRSIASPCRGMLTKQTNARHKEIREPLDQKEDKHKCRENSQLAERSKNAPAATSSRAPAVCLGMGNGSISDLYAATVCRTAATISTSSGSSSSRGSKADAPDFAATAAAAEKQEEGEQQEEVAARAIQAEAGSVAAESVGVVAAARVVKTAKLVKEKTDDVEAEPAVREKVEAAKLRDEKSAEAAKARMAKAAHEKEPAAVLASATGPTADSHSETVTGPSHESTLLPSEMQASSQSDQDAPRHVLEQDCVKARAEDEARQQAGSEAQKKAEEHARLQVQLEAETTRRKAAEEACKKAADSARRKAEEDAKQKAEEAARQKVEAEARQKAKEEAETARRKAAEEACKKAAEAARRKAEEDAKQKAEEAARQKVEAEARQKAKEERRKAREEAKQRAEEEARRRAAEDTRAKAEEEARHRAAEEARLKAEAEARQIVAEETQLKDQEDVQQRAAEEALKAEEEARQVEVRAQQKAAEEVAKLKVTEAAKVPSAGGSSLKASDVETSGRSLASASHSPQLPDERQVQSASGDESLLMRIKQRLQNSSSSSSGMQTSRMEKQNAEKASGPCNVACDSNPAKLQPALRGEPARRRVQPTMLKQPAQAEAAQVQAAEDTSGTLHTAVIQKAEKHLLATGAGVQQLDPTANQEACVEKSQNMPPLGVGAAPPAPSTVSSADIDMNSMEEGLPSTCSAASSTILTSVSSMEGQDRPGLQELAYSPAGKVSHDDEGMPDTSLASAMECKQKPCLQESTPVDMSESSGKYSHDKGECDETYQTSELAAATESSTISPSVEGPEVPRFQEHAGTLMSALASPSSNITDALDEAIHRKPAAAAEPSTTSAHVECQEAPGLQEVARIVVPVPTGKGSDNDTRSGQVSQTANERETLYAKPKRPHVNLRVKRALRSRKSSSQDPGEQELDTPAREPSVAQAAAHTWRIRKNANTKTVVATGLLQLGGPVTTFQVTSQHAGGSLDEAERIVQLCVKRIISGASSEEWTRLRAQLCAAACCRMVSSPAIARPQCTPVLSRTAKKRDKAAVDDSASSPAASRSPHTPRHANAAKKKEELEHCTVASSPAATMPQVTMVRAHAEKEGLECSATPRLSLTGQCAVWDPYLENTAGLSSEALIAQPPDTTAKRSPTSSPVHQHRSTPEPSTPIADLQFECQRLRDLALEAEEEARRQEDLQQRECQRLREQAARAEEEARRVADEGQRKIHELRNKRKHLEEQASKVQSRVGLASASITDVSAGTQTAPVASSPTPKAKGGGGRRSAKAGVLQKLRKRKSVRVSFGCRMDDRALLMRIKQRLRPARPSLVGPKPTGTDQQDMDANMEQFDVDSLPDVWQELGRLLFASRVDSDEIPLIYLHKEWCGPVLQGEKTMEVRTWNRVDLGWQLLASQTKLIGCVCFKESFQMKASDFNCYYHQHRLAEVNQVPSWQPGKKLFGWNIESVKSFPEALAAPKTSGPVKVSNMLKAELFKQMMQDPDAVDYNNSHSIDPSLSLLPSFSLKDSTALPRVTPSSDSTVSAVSSETAASCMTAAAAVASAAKQSRNVPVAPILTTVDHGDSGLRSKDDSHVDLQWQDGGEPQKTEDYRVNGGNQDPNTLGQQLSSSSQYVAAFDEKEFVAEAPAACEHSPGLSFVLENEEADVEVESGCLAVPASSASRETCSMPANTSQSEELQVLALSQSSTSSQGAASSVSKKRRRSTKEQVESAKGKRRRLPNEGRQELRLLDAKAKPLPPRLVPVKPQRNSVSGSREGRSRLVQSRTQRGSSSASSSQEKSSGNSLSASLAFGSNRPRSALQDANFTRLRLLMQAYGDKSDT